MNERRCASFAVTMRRAGGNSCAIHSAYSRVRKRDPEKIAPRTTHAWRVSHDGDRAALRTMGRADTTQEADAIVRMHAGFVWRILSHLGVPANQLEPMSQRVLIRVHRRLGEFRGETSIT